MRDTESRNFVSRIGRHPVLAITLACVVLGSFGFAAAGGIEMIKSWFVSIEINGEQYDFEVVPDDDGVATLVVPVTTTGEEGETQLTVEFTGEPGDGDGQKRIDVTVEGTVDPDGDGEAVIEIRETDADDE